MSSLKRRHFLQAAAAALAGLGISQLDLEHQTLRYARVLAQPTRRKRALLVGINRYPTSPLFTDLRGSVQDVELQRRLLVDRFGFLDADIRILTDDAPEKPTRENILRAFEEHLVQACQDGDVAVFHFSGHGRRIADPTPVRLETGDRDPLNSTFVPADDARTNAPDEVNDIMGRTLFLLTAALKTDKVTVVLDSCYAGGGTRGNARIRSAGSTRSLRPSQQELEYQDRWMRELELDSDRLAALRDIGVAKGVFIAAAQRQQEAYDLGFDGFDAGALTYFMTQYLWQQTDTVSGTVARVGRSLQAERLVQTPISDTQAERGLERSPVFFIEEVNTAAVPPAEASIVSVGGSRGQIWLGGVDAASLVAFGAGARLSPVEGSGEVRIVSRSGLLAEVEVSGTVAPGVLLQEAARVIPADLSLRLGLDPSLGSDASLADQRLRSRRVEPVRAQSGNTPYPGEIHYILSRMTTPYAAHLRTVGAEPPPLNSLGLLSQSLDEVIPGSFGPVGETVAAAIARLTAKLTALVAARLVKLTLNAQSSRLNLEAVIRPQEAGGDLVAAAFTVRGGDTRAASALRATGQLPLHTFFQVQVSNREPVPLYLSILALSPSGDMVVLFPNDFRATDAATRIGATATLTIPSADDAFDLETQERGVGELLVIASRAPLGRALIALRNLAAEQRLASRSPVVPSLEAIADLIADLSDTRSGSSAAAAQLRTTDIAALSLTLEVI